MPRWQMRVSDVAPEVRELYTDVHPIILSGLRARGIVSATDIERYFTPNYERDIHDPFLFRDMERALERVVQAIAKHEPILIHGDYDADGITSSCILENTLRDLGATVEVFLPDRVQDGYGLKQKTVERAAQKGIRLLITADCGVTAVDEVALAKRLGIDTIVTDHHEPQDTLPDAVAIIHPLIPGETYPNKGLTGGGCAFKLVQGLLRSNQPAAMRLRSQVNAEDDYWHGYEKWLLDLVAISTIADCGPLTGENRSLVYWGLVVLAKTRRIGLKRLLEQCPIEHGVTAETIGYYLAPRINAAGRMQHPMLAYELLATKDPARAHVLAAALDQANRQRQVITRVMTEEINIVATKSQESVAVYAQPHWPIGIVGLVAGSLSQRLDKPVFLLTQVDGQWVGSGRSGEGFNCLTALRAAQDCLERFGGHEHACGFTLKDISMLEDFKKSLNAGAGFESGSRGAPTTVWVDGELSFDRASEDFARQLQQCEPFGIGNEPFLLYSPDYRLTRRTLMSNGKHARVYLQRGTHEVNAIGFGLGERAGALSIGARLDCIYSLELKSKGGTQELEIKLRDIESL